MKNLSEKIPFVINGINGNKYSQIANCNNDVIKLLQMVVNGKKGKCSKW